MDPKSTQPEQPPRAGRSEPFPSGRLTFLAPLPLPTGLPPVFGWQMALGGPFFCLVLVVFRLSYRGLQ